MSEYNNSDELYHHGRLGMKWYQHIFGQAYAHAKYNKKAKAETKEKIKKINKDTNDKIRKMKIKAKQDAKLKKAKNEADEKVEKAKTLLEKKYGLKTKSPNKNSKEKPQNKKQSIKDTVKDMSEEELRSKTNRLTAEKNYIEAVRNRAALEDTNSKAKAFVDKALKNVVEPATSNIGQQILQSLMAKGINDGFKLEKSDYKIYANNKKKS